MQDSFIPLVFILDTYCVGHLSPSLRNNIILSPFGREIAKHRSLMQLLFFSSPPLTVRSSDIELQVGGFTDFQS